MTTNRIPVCPECGRDWSKRLPPFKALSCETCLKRKLSMINFIGSKLELKAIAAREARPVLTGEALRQAAEAGRRELYPDDYKEEKAPAGKTYKVKEC